MKILTFDAISPLDGRYRNTCEPLAAYFSEASLMRYRVKIEIAYYIALCEVPLPELKNIRDAQLNKLRELFNNPEQIDVSRIKEIESITNHDVKAVEYYLKEVFKSELNDDAEFIHFGLTSQDINNTAGPLALKDAMQNIIIPSFNELLFKLEELSEEWRQIPLLAHTHGQPASPTSLGKEFAVFKNRIQEQLRLLSTIPYSAKFGGATGNFNAHYIAYPNIDWNNFGDKFVNGLGLKRSQITTQIEHYDNLAALFDNIKRINTILIDLSRDVWTYISMNYFTQEVKKGEVGSSAMPHKVNPIDFENAEGNLGMANAVFEHMSSKLPVSRLQRDLSDSTVLRNTGVPIAHTLISIKSLLKGLNKIKVNEVTIHNDLSNNIAVLAEAIQTILRREKYPNPYEVLKELTRTGEKVTLPSLHTFIRNLDVSDEVRNELLALSPQSYIGNASKF